MKTHTISPLVLAFALTTIAQPSFAMKRIGPWNQVDQLSVMIDTLTLLIATLRAGYGSINFIPEYNPKDPQTWVPHDGISYDPETGEPKLTWDDTEPSPFAELPDELLPLIFSHLGPKGRSRCMAVDHRFKQAVDLVRMPVTKGGLGYTDTLPTIATLSIGKGAERPIICGQMLYVTNPLQNTICAIDTNKNQVVAAIKVGRTPWVSTKCGESLYVSNEDDGTVCIIDINTNQVIHSINVGRTPWISLLHGQMLYVPNCLDGTLSVVDTHTNQVVYTIEVGKRPLKPVAYGQMLYVTEYLDSTVCVIDSKTNQIVDSIKVGLEPRPPVICGHMLYVANYLDGTLSVIDSNTNKVVATIPIGERIEQPVACHQKIYVADARGHEVFVIDTNTNQVVAKIDVGDFPEPPVAHGNMLYVARHGGGSDCVVNKDTNDVVSKGLIIIVDTKTNEVVASVEVGKNPQSPVAYEQTLYVANHGNGTVSVIDIGGYLPNQL